MTLESFAAPQYACNCGQVYADKMLQTACLASHPTVDELIAWAREQKHEGCTCRACKMKMQVAETLERLQRDDATWRERWLEGQTEIASLREQLGI